MRGYRAGVLLLVCLWATQIHAEPQLLAERVALADSLCRTLYALYPFTAEDSAVWAEECDSLRMIARLDDEPLHQRVERLYSGQVSVTDPWHDGLTMRLDENTVSHDFLTLVGRFSRLRLDSHLNRECAFRTPTSPQTATPERLHPLWCTVTWQPLKHRCGILRVVGNADSLLIARFDDALIHARKSRAILLDLRELNATSWDTIRVMLGRFTNKPLPAVRYRRSAGHSSGTTDSLLMVQPRGEWQYRGPILVLHGWSAPASFAAACLMERPRTAVQSLAERPGYIAGPDTDLFTDYSDVALPMGAALHVPRTRVMNADGQRAVRTAWVIGDISDGGRRVEEDFTRRWEGVLSHLYALAKSGAQSPAAR